MGTQIVTRNEAWKASKKNKTTQAPEPPIAVERPDDKVMRESSERQAAQHIDAFMAKLTPDRIKSLVQTYADANAQEILDQIREDFWANLPCD